MLSLNDLKKKFMDINCLIKFKNKKYDKNNIYRTSI